MKRLVGSVAVALLVGAPFSGTASAHAAYESSDPANGSTVSSPPSRVIADFTERLNSDASSLSVFDPCGSQVDNDDSLIANDRITISMSADKQGTYVVQFNVLSAVDGHPTHGQFTFTSSGGQPCPGEDDGDTGGSSGGGDDGGSGGGSGGGGTGGGDGSGSGGGDGGSGGGSGGGNDGGNAGETRTGAGAGANGRGRSKDTTNGGGASGRANTTDDGSGAGELTASEEQVIDTDQGTSTSIWDGIPIGDFLVALGVAALIGAAGGRIYAGIVVPRP